MNRTKSIKGECQHCRGRLEFAVDHIGLVAPCPHCGQETELLLARPPEEPAVPRKVVGWTVAAVLILLVGLAGSLVALKQAQGWAARRKQAPEGVQVAVGTKGSPERVTPDQHGFNVSGITLEKAPGTSLVYAVGTVRNELGKQRFGVRIELDLFDATEQKVGTAKDYQQVIEPGAEWRFKALVVESKASSARLASLKEDQ
jgi:hypothetical protein